MRRRDRSMAIYAISITQSSKCSWIGLDIALHGKMSESRALLFAGQAHEEGRDRWKVWYPIRCQLEKDHQEDGGLSALKVFLQLLWKGKSDRHVIRERVGRVSLLADGCPLIISRHHVTLPLPSQFSVKRTAVGIWDCKACGKSQAGGAYVLK